VQLFFSFLIILLGVVWRTVRPYLKKLKAYYEALEKAEESGQPAPAPFRFKMRFLISAAISFFSCLIIAMMIMGIGSPLFEDPLRNFFALFAWGAGQTEIINRELL